MTEELFIKSKDGLDIAGDFYAGATPLAPAVIFLHMMPAVKNSWASIAKKLQEKGVQSLAIDLRGHGKSFGGPAGYLNFKDSEHRESIYDLEAAVNYFTELGVPPSKITLVGASIGANLVLWWMAEHSDFLRGVLISPGLDYKGILTESLAKKLTLKQSVFLASGGENDAYSTETAEKIYSIVSKETLASKGMFNVLRVLQNAGHGTTIFKEHPSFAEEVVSWITYGAN